MKWRKLFLFLFTEKHAAWPTVEGYFNLIVSLALQLDTAARRECKFDYSCRFQINYHLKQSDGPGRWNFEKQTLQMESWRKDACHCKFFGYFYALDRNWFLQIHQSTTQF